MNNEHYKKYCRSCSRYWHKGEYVCTCGCKQYCWDTPDGIKIVKASDERKD